MIRSDVMVKLTSRQLLRHEFVKNRVHQRDVAKEIVKFCILEREQQLVAFVHDDDDDCGTKSTSHTQSAELKGRKRFHMGSQDPGVRSYCNYEHTRTCIGRFELSQCCIVHQ